MATTYIPVDGKYYNSQLVGRVYTYSVFDLDTQAEVVHYALEYIGGQIVDIPEQIYQAIVSGQYSPTVTVDDALSETSVNPVQNKVIYGELEDIRAVAEGKAANFVVDDTTNTAFDSQADTIALTSSFTDINNVTIQLDTLRIGDVIYVTQTDVPDRWVQTITLNTSDEVVSVTLGKMETAKVPVLDVEVNGVSVVNNSMANVQIKTVNGTDITGTGDATIRTYQSFPSSWSSSVSGTTSAFCATVDSDIAAEEGVVFLGELTCSDLPASMANAEAVVEIISSVGSSGKVIHITIFSGNTAPYRWEYTYWNSGSNVSGWIGFQNQLLPIQLMMEQ